MNPIEILLSEPFAQTLGWTLLHFVWQGGLVALLLIIALRVLRRHDPVSGSGRNSSRSGTYCRHTQGSP